MSSSAAKSPATALRLFDAHCHLQDPRIASAAPAIIRTALRSGVLRFAVNGVSEKDWHLVKRMSEDYDCVVPCFGLHPWYVAERSPDWLRKMREMFAETPAAAVGEIGLDKGSHGKNIEFAEQIEVLRQQLELAKELERPVSIHCVRAFGDLLEVLQSAGSCYLESRLVNNAPVYILHCIIVNGSIGPFPAGVILHSYLGSAEMVSGFAKLGSYFSFSGFLTSMKLQKAKKILKSVPIDRILFESDAPDGLPRFRTDSIYMVPSDISTQEEIQNMSGNSSSDASTSLHEELNHPANIHHVLNYVSTLLEMPEEELAEASYLNASRLFCYPGSKICSEREG